MNKFLTTLVLLSMMSQGLAETAAWVTVDSLNRRTCPEASCGVVGKLGFREKATILEEKEGWARITKYYDASCRNGRSEYVDEGNSLCVPSNGIENGSLAEWVSARYLSATRPADPGAGAAGNYALVKGSDDYRIYKDTFAKAAGQLVASGRCSAADFKEMGGWVKSSQAPMYFMYCGGMTIQNKVYLNAETGKIGR